MISIDSKLGAIKGNARELLDEQRILELCRAHGYRPEADGKLDPATVIALFMQQIAGGNLSCDEVRLIDKARFSASGYCQARMRLPQGVIEAMARETYQKFTGAMDGDAKHCWRGHRVLLIDSTSFSMPDTAELQAQFGQPGQQKSGCGFPVAHVLMLFNARTGLAVDAITAPLRTHEMSIAAGSHQRMHAGDLVVGDDSFRTYAHFALLGQRGLHGLFPLHHKRIADFTANRPCIEPRAVARASEAKGLPRSRWIKSLGKDDQLVEKYPADELFEVRLRRWDVETDLRHLKTTMKMEILHCKTVAGVQKELWMFLLIYNMVRAVMVQAAQRQEAAVSRISFAGALHWMRHARPGDDLLPLAIVPDRPNRLEPQAVKRRPKQYDRLSRPRHQMREEARARMGVSAGEST